MSLEELASNRSIPDTEKIAEVSRQFEAVLLRQILQDIRKPVLGSEPESTTNSIYSDMINNQLAQSISGSGEFGLAKSLQAQLSRQVLPAKNSSLEPKS
jgi:Rod binding domain-containing protein